jgi:uncharacterized membrane protein YdjX (TVP38/TMEM64 family)
MIKQHKKILLLIFLISAVALVRFSGIGDVLSFENLKREREHLAALVQAHYLLSVVYFITIYIVVASLSIPGAEVLTLAGGFLFGTLPATLYVNVGATTGATVAFLAARYLLGNWLQRKYQEKLGAFNEKMKKNGSRYLLSLRLVPVFPFFLINLLSGFTNVSVKTFAWTTALGIIPGTAVFAYAGRQIGSINSPSEILSAGIIIAFAVLALFALLPAMLDRFRAMKNAP